MCIWPSHFKTKLRINKAIMTKEMPQEVCDWEELPIKRIFGIASKLNVLSNQTGCSILTYTKIFRTQYIFEKNVSNQSCRICQMNYLDFELKFFFGFNKAQ